MDLVIAVVFCNCTIAIVLLVITIWTIGFRRQITAWRKCFDRWNDDCNLLLRDAPQSLAVSKAQIHYLRQIYRQQLVTLDRLRALGLFWGIFRSLFLNRRRAI
jgi:hypothetical protein